MAGSIGKRPAKVAPTTVKVNKNTGNALNGPHPGFKSVKRLAGPHPGFKKRKRGGLQNGYQT